MTVVWLTGLPPGVDVGLFPAAKVDEWARRHQMPPAAWNLLPGQQTSATGTVMFDLPDNQEFMAITPDGYGRRVMSATTVVVDP
jgi:hypothetical protein